MYSLCDDGDAWAEYRTPPSSRTPSEGTRSPSPVMSGGGVNAGAGVSRDSNGSPVKTPVDEAEEFYQWLMNKSLHVDLTELSTTPVDWSKLPECPVCASGNKLDVLRLARSCLCSPYPCDGHVCACAKTNVTPAGLFQQFPFFNALLFIGLFMCCLWFSSFDWVISMLQSLCIQHVMVSYSRSFTSC